MNPIYKYSDTGVVKDGHEMFPQDACKDLQCLQRNVVKLERALSGKSQSTGMNPKEENIYVFAARYIQSRNTGAALMVVKQLINKWSEFSPKTKRKIVKESHEARYCHKDWQMLRDHAGEEQRDDSNRS